MQKTYENPGNQETRHRQEKAWELPLGHLIPCYFARVQWWAIHVSRSPFLSLAHHALKCHFYKNHMRKWTVFHITSYVILFLQSYASQVFLVVIHVLHLLEACLPFITVDMFERSWLNDLHFEAWENSSSISFRWLHMYQEAEIHLRETRKFSSAALL